MSISAAESITHLDLDSAIKSKQLTTGFEPYVSLRKLEARGVELHLAWQHPQFGPLTPGLFMPFIAAEGRSREITGFMLREAARAAADWRRTGLDWTVSIDVPLEDLVDGTLPSTLGVLLDEFDLPPETFVIDVSESDLLARSAQALPAITGLRALGCGVALDSAPGEAMIQDLRGLPFTEIKVSGAAIVQFIDRTRHSGEGRVAARVYNARSNGLPITAVGVDSEAMLWSVQRLDFDAAQGSYICAPCDAMSLLRWEKIWREAAENIRTRKLSSRKPLASGRTQRAQPASAPAPVEMARPPLADAPIAAAEKPPIVHALAPPPPLLAEEFQTGEIEPIAEVEEATFQDVPPPLDEPDAKFDDFDFGETRFDEALPPLVEMADEPDLAEPEAEADLSEGQPDLPVAAKPADVPAAAQPEETVRLIARNLPGISKPIVMSIQNHGPERFGFLKRMARKR